MNLSVVVQILFDVKSSGDILPYFPYRTPAKKTLGFFFVFFQTKKKINIREQGIPPSFPGRRGFNCDCFICKLFGGSCRNFYCQVPETAYSCGCFRDRTSCLYSPPSCRGANRYTFLHAYSLSAISVDVQIADACRLYLNVIIFIVLFMFRKILLNRCEVDSTGIIFCSSAKIILTRKTNLAGAASVAVPWAGE